MGSARRLHVTVHEGPPSDVTEIDGSAPGVSAQAGSRSRRRRSLRGRIAAVSRSLAPYARPHRRQLAAAVAGSLLVVAARLAFPWPLRGIVDLTLPESARSGWLSALGTREAAVAWLVSALVILGAGMGLAEYRQRLAVARFTVGTVNGARLGMLDRLLKSSSPSDPGRYPGDVLTRAVGDTARLRVGLRGVLVHVLQHGIFVVGVCVVFTVLDIRLGLAYLVGAVAAAAVAAAGTARTSTVARERRSRESRMAERVLRLATDPDAETKKSDPDRPRTGAEVTRIKGRTSLAVQGVLGLTACAVLLVAVQLEETGRLRTGDLVVVASYLLMLHHPMVRLGRQVTRLGPQLASAERLARLATRSRNRKTSTVAPAAAILGGVTDAGAVTDVREADVRTVAEQIGVTSTAKLAAVGKAVGLHAYVSELPEGYDTPVGKGAVPLSPTQQLRLDAARRLTVGGARSAVAAGAPPPPGGQAVPNDPVLPTLATLLDPSAMAPLLGDLLEDGLVPDVRVRSVRYKPGANVVVQYDVAVRRGWAEAVAYASAERDLREKPARRRTSKLASRAARRNKAPLAEPVVWLAEIDALVQWLPLDVRIPLLSDGAAKLTRRLHEAGVAVEGAGVKPKLLRYWPRRRAVLRLGDHIVKAYRDLGDFAAAEQGLRAAGALRRVETAAFEAVLPQLLATVQARVRGRPPSLPPRRSEPAGAVLAELHAEALLGIPTVTTADLLAKAATRAELVRHLVPALAGTIDVLVADLAARRPAAVPPVTSHGNFHAGQLLRTRSGLAVIDVDRICLAHPGYDLATYAAHVAFGAEGEDELVAATLDSLVTGYGHRPDDLMWLLATCLLRRAPVPFRHLDDRWPEATAALIASARASLGR